MSVAALKSAQDMATKVVDALGGYGLYAESATGVAVLGMQSSSQAGAGHAIVGASQTGYGVAAYSAACETPEHQLDTSQGLLAGVDSPMRGSCTTKAATAQ